MDINLSKQFKLVTAYTHSVIYYSGTSLITLTGVNHNNLIWYDINVLSEDTINKDRAKYEYCIKSGLRERRFLIQYFIEKGFTDYFTTDVDSTYDYFDACVRVGDTIKLIEVKFRDKKFKTDYLFEKKYRDLFKIVKNNSKLKIDVIYFCIYPDYTYRSYTMNNIAVTFDKEVWIADYPGSPNKKLAINCELSPKIDCVSGRINFK